MDNNMNNFNNNNTSHNTNNSAHSAEDTQRNNAEWKNRGFTNSEKSSTYMHNSWKPNELYTAYPENTEEENRKRSTFSDFNLKNNSDTQSDFFYNDNLANIDSNSGNSNNGGENNYNAGKYHNNNFGNSYKHNSNNTPPMDSEYKIQSTENLNNKNNANVFAILTTVFITAILTSVIVWGLARQGVLPGTAANTNFVDRDRQEIEGLGLSIYTDDPDAVKSADKLAQIVKLLQNNYFKVLSDDEILETMNKGLLNSIDNPYTYYLSKEDVAAFRDSIEGNYSGIGATVKMNEANEFIVYEIIEKGPADKAGVKTGDKILRLNNVEVSELANVAELAKIARGPNGSKVKIALLRGEEEIELEITRMPVEMKVVRTRMLDDNVGYMNVVEFTTTLPKQFAVALKDLIEQGAKDIVFDMRGNPGGSASALIDVMSMLLDKDTLIAEIRGRSEGEPSLDVWRTSGEKLVSDDMNFAVLVNGHTASAAELFSGALKDHDKAVLIGSKTYGKGSGTSTYPLIDGSAANITIFNYYLPNGDLIEGEGIKVDIESEGPAIEVLKKKAIYELSPEEDPDLTKALQYFAEEK